MIVNPGAARFPDGSHVVVVSPVGLSGKIRQADRDAGRRSSVEGNSLPTLDKSMKVRMTDDEHAFLSRAAKAQGKSLSAFIRDAVDREATAIVAEHDASGREEEESVRRLTSPTPRLRDLGAIGGEQGGRKLTLG